MTNYDPYHYCKELKKCCIENTKLQNQHSFFTIIKNSAKKYQSYNFTYKNWKWYDEFFFEELYKPELLPDTACGLCPICIKYKGKQNCLFPQLKNSYSKWYNNKKNILM